LTETKQYLDKTGYLNKFLPLKLQRVSSNLYEQPLFVSREKLHNIKVMIWRW
jgi:hypothetical protein